MIPQRLVLATANPGKAQELRTLVLEWGNVDVLDLQAFPTISLPPETAPSYAQNAAAKARAVATATGLPALADDSGLEVDALGGQPGVRSARWAGPYATDGERIAKLLGVLAGVPEEARGARFRCAVALAWPDDGLEVAEGECTGRIAHRPDGRGGFGYDPVFVSDETGCSLGRATAVEKLRVSHRARAMRLLGRRLQATGRRPLRAGEGPC
jgi:XTP/dITP diphosphohydrolase